MELESVNQDLLFKSVKPRPWLFSAIAYYQIQWKQADKFKPCLNSLKIPDDIWLVICLLHLRDIKLQMTQIELSRYCSLEETLLEYHKKTGLEMFGKCLIFLEVTSKRYLKGMFSAVLYVQEPEILEMCKVLIWECEQYNKWIKGLWFFFKKILWSVPDKAKLSHVNSPTNYRSDDVKPGVESKIIVKNELDFSRNGEYF